MYMVPHHTQLPLTPLPHAAAPAPTPSESDTAVAAPGHKVRLASLTAAHHAQAQGLVRPRPLLLLLPRLATLRLTAVAAAPHA